MSEDSMVTMLLEPLRREFVAEVRALRAELGGELRGIRQHLEVQNGRVGRSEARADSIDHRQEKIEMFCATCNPGNESWHLQHLRDHRAEGELIALRADTILTRGSLWRLFGLVAAAAGTSVAVVSFLRDYLSGP